VTDNILPALREYYQWLKYNNDGVEPDFLQSKYFDFNKNEYKYNLLYYHHNLILQALRQKAKGQSIDNHQNLEEIDHIISTPMSLFDTIEFIRKYYQLKDNNYTRTLLVNIGIFREDMDYLINKQIRDSLLRNIGYCHITNDGIKIIRQFIFENSKSFKCISVGSGLGFIEYCLENYEDEHVQKLSIDCYDMLIGFNDKDGIDTNGWKCPIIEDISSDLRTDSIDYDILLLSWPPESKSVAHNSIRRFSGNIEIYIGEYHEAEVDRSCTADDKFHQYLEQNFELKHKFSSIKFLYNMQVPGAITHSSINLLSRKN
jgi:hypothetical protein